MAQIIQNFYLSGSNFGGFYLPGANQKLDKEIANITPAVAAVAKKPDKSSAKKWLIIAAWILMMTTGIGLAVAGGLTAISLMGELGLLITTSSIGLGIKIFEKTFESKNSK